MELPEPEGAPDWSDEPGDEAAGGSPDDDLDFRAPLPPDDRIWRHPSELAWSEPRAARRRRRSAATRGWPVAIVSGLIGSVLTVSVMAATGALDEEEPREVVIRETVRPAGLASPAAGGVVAVAERVGPAIVRLEVTGTTQGSGSGVVFRSDGHLLTNAHVVVGARRITVVLADGRELRGHVVGSDEETDIAVVRIDSDERFPTAVLGTAVSLRVGEPAIAIGSPLGLSGGSSVTTGVISALGRRVQSREGPPLLDMIQTDAAIAPGSSGGALLDSSGVVIGVTTAIAVTEVGAEGLGFATPIDIARAVAQDIMQSGQAQHVWLGIEGTDAGGGEGALVKRVAADSPAAAVGLQEGDVIVAVDGEPVPTMSALVILLRGRDPDDEISLQVRRDGEQLLVRVQLAPRPDGD